MCPICISSYAVVNSQVGELQQRGDESGRQQNNQNFTKDKIINEKEQKNNEVTKKDTLKYDNTKAGFWFIYPKKLTIIDERIPTNLERQNSFLSISVNDIDTLDFPSGHDKETAIKNIASLKNGDYGIAVDWPLNDSKEVKTLNSKINAQKFVSLAAFEVCSIKFDNELVFYKNNYEIILNLYAPSKKIINDNPKYFKLDNENGCMVWKSQEKFYKDLIQGKISGTAKQWFDDFNGIVDTIILE